MPHAVSAVFTDIPANIDLQSGQVTADSGIATILDAFSHWSFYNCGMCAFGARREPQVDRPDDTKSANSKGGACTASRRPLCHETTIRTAETTVGFFAQTLNNKGKKNEGRKINARRARRSDNGVTGAGGARIRRTGQHHLLAGAIDHESVSFGRHEGTGSCIAGS
ncbi:MAG: hypothetical protein AAF724_05280 [Pseudomonadota bacterium]